MSPHLLSTTGNLHFIVKINFPSPSVKIIFQYSQTHTFFYQSTVTFSKTDQLKDVKPRLPWLSRIPHFLIDFRDSANHSLLSEFSLHFFERNVIIVSVRSAVVTFASSSRRPISVAFLNHFPSIRNAKQILSTKWNRTDSDAWRFVFNNRIITENEDLSRLATTVECPISIIILRSYAFFLNSRSVRYYFAPKDTIGFVIRELEEREDCRITALSVSETRTLGVTERLKSAGSSLIRAAVQGDVETVKIFFEPGHSELVTIAREATVKELIALARKKFSYEVMGACFFLCDAVRVFADRDSVCDLPKQLYCVAVSEGGFPVPVVLPGGLTRAFSVPHLGTVAVLKQFVQKSVTEKITGIMNGGFQLQLNRLLCSVLFESPGQLLIADICPHFISLNFENFICRFSIETELTLRYLSEWIAERFEQTEFEILNQQNELLPETWIAKPSTEPITLRISRNVSSQKITFIDRDSTCSYNFKLDLHLKVKDLIALLKQQNAGEYKFWIDSQQIWDNENDPLFSIPLPMTGIEFTRSPLPLEVTLVLPPNARIESVTLPANGTVGDAMTLARSYLDSRGFSLVLTVRDSGDRVLNDDFPLREVPGCCDLFFSSVLEIQFVDRAVSPPTFSQAEPDEAFKDRQIANRYGVVFEPSCWESQPSPFILLRPGAAVSLNVQFEDGTVRDYLVDGDSMVATFLPVLFEKERQRLVDGNGAVSADLFLKSIAGKLVCTGEAEQPIDEFVCSFVVEGKVFQIVLKVSDTIDRVKELFCRQYAANENEMRFEYKGRELENNCVVCEVENSETDPIVIKGGRIVIEEKMRPSNYNLLVFQLERVSKQPLTICKRLFDDNKWDYEATLNVLRGES